MPYFIYKVGKLNLLEQLGVEENFRDAKSRARELRARLEPDRTDTVRIIFAANELEAEDLLSQPSGTMPGVFGDD